MYMHTHTRTHTHTYIYKYMYVCNRNSPLRNSLRHTSSGRGYNVKEQVTLLWIALSCVWQWAPQPPVTGLCHPDHEVTAAAPDIFISLPVYLGCFTDIISDPQNAWCGRQGVSVLLNELIRFAQGHTINSRPNRVENACFSVHRPENLYDI